MKRNKETSNIRKVGLYQETKIKQTVLECARIAFEKGPDLKTQDFSALDLLHYLGTTCLEKFLIDHGVSELSKIVDVGAGFGGPARFIAATYGCKVHALELLPQNVRVGFVLNRLQNLQDKVIYYCVDVTNLNFLDLPELESTHDILVSQLCLLHIGNKEKLYQSIFKLLKPGGEFYIEDFFLKDGVQLTSEELSNLENDIYVPNGRVLTREEYSAFLEKNELELTSWSDVTNDWSHFVWQRYNEFLKKEEENAKYGAEYVNDLAHFYKQMAVLFHGDIDFRKQFKYASSQIAENLPVQQHLGGVILTGRKRLIKNT